MICRALASSPKGLRVEVLAFPLRGHPLKPLNDAGGGVGVSEVHPSTHPWLLSPDFPHVVLVVPPVDHGEDGELQVEMPLSGDTCGRGAPRFTWGLGILVALGRSVVAGSGPPRW